MPLNSLTGLIPNMYAGLNVVNREMVGFIPAIAMDSDVSKAAVGQVVRSPVAAVGATEDIVAGQLPANTGNATMTYVDVSITKSRAVPIAWTGEEQLGVGSSGKLDKLLTDQFAEAMRRLTNEVDADLALCAKQNASRAIGTAGTTPFATAGDLSDIALLRQILEDNGSPITDLQFVGNSAAWANLRGKQSVLFKMNEAGTDQMLREGMMGRLEGFATRNSAGILTHTKGTGASYTSSAAGFAVGTTSVPIITGTGTVLAGDVGTFAGDANKYVVKTGVAAPGTITLGKPGLQAALAASATALTIGNSYKGNFGFNRNAIVLAARAPALPAGGDSAVDRRYITDPMSGLTFEVSLYTLYRQIKIEVALAWGCAAANEAQIATLLG